jgi:hypothetical protein
MCCSLAQRWWKVEIEHIKKSPLGSQYYYLVDLLLNIEKSNLTNILKKTIFMIDDILSDKLFNLWLLEKVYSFNKNNFNIAVSREYLYEK